MLLARADIELSGGTTATVSAVAGAWFAGAHNPPRRRAIAPASAAAEARPRSVVARCRPRCGSLRGCAGDGARHGRDTRDGLVPSLHYSSVSTQPALRPQEKGLWMSSPSRSLPLQARGAAPGRGRLAGRKILVVGAGQQSYGNRGSADRQR